MKFVLWIIAALTGLIGGAFVAFCVHGIVARGGESANDAFLLPGFLLCAAAGGWCVTAAFRFMRRTNETHAIKLGRPASVLLFMLMIGVFFSELEPAVSQIHPLLTLAGPFVAGFLAWTYFARIHKPMARRAYPETDHHDESSGAPTEGAPISKHADLGQLRTILEPTDELYRQLRTRLLVFSLPLGALATGAGVFLGLGPASNKIAVAMAGIFVGLVFGVSMIVSYRTQRRSLATLRIAISDHGIARTQNGFPPQAIRFDEIETVMEFSTKGLLMLGRNRMSRVFIPRHLSDFESLRAQLDKIHPITPGKSSSLAPFIGTAAGLATIAAMVIAFRATNRITVTVVACTLIVGLLTTLAIIRRSPHLDRRTKRASWMVMFPIAGLGFRLWLVWTTTL